MKRFIELLCGKGYFGFADEDDGSGDGMEKKVEEPEQPAEPEPPADDGIPDELPDDFDFEGEVAKRGAKNVFGEMLKTRSEKKKLQEKIKEYEAKLNAAPPASAQPGKPAEKPIYIEELKKVLNAEGISEAAAVKLIDTIERISYGVAGTVAGPATDLVNERHFETAISDIKKDKDYSYEARTLEKELREMLMDPTMVKPEFRNDPGVIRIALEKLSFKHRKRLYGDGVKGNTELEEVIKGDGNGSGGSGTGISENEAQKYASDNNLPFRTAEDKKEARELLRLKKNVDAAYNNPQKK